MYFDRFDICLAHWAFAASWHDGMGSATYAKFAQLDRLRFSPGMWQTGQPRDLTPNAKEIYKQLVINHCGGIKSTLTA